MACNVGGQGANSLMVQVQHLDTMQSTAVFSHHPHFARHCNQYSNVISTEVR